MSEVKRTPRTEPRYVACKASFPGIFLLFYFSLEDEAPEHGPRDGLSETALSGPPRQLID